VGRRGRRFGVGSIDCLESVLVPADSAFGFLMGRDRSRLDEVARELSKEWGRLDFIDVEALRELRAEIGEAFHDAAAGDRWVRLCEALAGGDYEPVLRLLLQHNAFVMGRAGRIRGVRDEGRRRGVASWMRRESSRGKSSRGLGQQLFLNPLKQVVLTLGTSDAGDPHPGSVGPLPGADGGARPQGGVFLTSRSIRGSSSRRCCRSS
jgi:hypothetical protein